MRYVSTLMRIQTAFENAGIRFLDDDAGAAGSGFGFWCRSPKSQHRPNILRRV
jgi:hypothetical protein